jgi:hypothetical protein
MNHDALRAMADRLNLAPLLLGGIEVGLRDDVLAATR